MKVDSRSNRSSQIEPIARESQISRLADIALALAPARKTVLPSLLHFPRSHSIPSVLTTTGSLAARNRGHQNPFAIFSIRTASKRRRLASSAELRPKVGVDRDFESRPGVATHCTPLTVQLRCPFSRARQ